MTIVELALAGDPTTPAHVLTELAHHTRTPGTGTHVTALLTVHPTLPDTDVPDPTADGSDMEHTDALADTLGQPHATTGTRARLLTRTTTRVLLEHCAGASEPDPAAFAELATRTPTGQPDVDIPVNALLAMDPDTPDGRRLDALKSCLRTPTGQLGATLRHVGLRASDLRPLLTTIALRYPDQLRQLADTATDTQLRDLLTGAAARHDAGIDVLTEHLSAYASRTAGASAHRWADTIRHTGDPAIATAALDAGGRIAMAAADAILGHPCLSRTPVRRRAHARRVTGTDAPTDLVTTPADARVHLIRHDPRHDTAHRRATTTPAHDTDDNRRAVLAGWARLHHHGDLTQPVNPAVVRQTVPPFLVRYATHPAMPEEHRQAAAHHFTSANHTFAAPTYDQHHRHLTYLAAHATTLPQLRQALLDMPLPDLRSVCFEDGALEPLLAHHLAVALRPHHAHLTPAATRTLVTLADTFPGTVLELLTTATTVAT